MENVEKGTDVDGLFERGDYLNAQSPLSRDEVTWKWMERFHWYNKRPRTTTGAKFERIISALVTLTLVCVLIAWGFFIYEKLRLMSESNLKELNQLRIEFEKYKQIRKFKTEHDDNDDESITKIVGDSARKKSSSRDGYMRSSKNVAEDMQLVTTTAAAKATTKKTSEDTIMIKLTGNNQLESSLADQPLHSWKKKSQTGNISFQSGKYVLIHRKGTYFVQAQMFFGNNTSLLSTKEGKDFILDFAIVNKHSRVASASIPLPSCLSSCTSVISQIVKLNAKDFLSVQSSQKDQVFNMFSEKVHFLIYRLH